MLVALSDTHGRDGTRLTPHLREVLRDGDRVLHAGDFTTAAVLDGFEQLGRNLTAVTGNRDGPGVRARLPESATVDWDGHRILLAHGHRHDSTSLSLLARQEDADVIVTGHSHQPVIDELDGRRLVNPGSHADPRGNQAAYAVFTDEGAGTTVELRTPTGEAFSTSRV